MADEIPTQDATFFAASDPSQLLSVEIEKIEARLSALKAMQTVAKCLQNTLRERPVRGMANRAQRLGDAVNEDTEHVFVRELESLDFDQLCFLAKAYTKSMSKEPRADCLQVFMLKHKVTVDEKTRKFVAQGADRAGGRFLEIYQNARQRQSKDLAEARATLALSRRAVFTQKGEGAPPRTTLAPIPKVFLPKVFHEDFIKMMMEDKTYGGVEARDCCNVKVLVYDDVTEWRIEVPRGKDPRTIDILAKQGRGEIVHHDTIDVIVVKTDYVWW